MKQVICTAALMLATTFSQQIIQTDSPSDFIQDAQQENLFKGSLLHSEVTRTKLGSRVEEHHYENIVEKKVDVAPKPDKMNDEQKANLLNDMSDEIQALQEGKFSFDLSNDVVFGCNNRLNTTDPTEVGLFMPVYADYASPSRPTASWEGVCYSNIEMTFESISESSFDIVFNLQGKRSALCKEGILLANTEITHFELFFRSGKHKITFNMPGEAEQQEVAFGGIKAFYFCEHVKEELESLVRTFGAFGIGPYSSLNHHKVHQLGASQKQEEANLRFINLTMGWDMEIRPIQNVDIDLNLMKSGDFLSCMGATGLGSIISYGTGSYIAHSVMALWFEDGLYAVESTDPSIMRTPMEEFLKVHYYDMVAWLPLREEIADKFNETAAREFYFKYEGVPYGYHNFLYGWVDTPEDNFPPLLPHKFVPILFSLIEQFDKPTSDLLYTEALNNRLEVSGKNITEVAAIAGQQGKGLDDVMAEIELDDYIYHGLGPLDGPSYVCSAFVTALWKAAGLFEPYEILAKEFHPADVYKMNFFDTTTPRPDACVEADPNIPYCQLIGKYRQVLPGYNTIDPYDHMNERCPSLAPDYYRPDGC